jgi:hypothetical protein
MRMHRLNRQQRQALRKDFRKKRREVAALERETPVGPQLTTLEKAERFLAKVRAEQ